MHPKLYKLLKTYIFISNFRDKKFHRSKKIESLKNYRFRDSGAQQF